MASPLDVNACYDAIYTAATLNEMGHIKDTDFEEIRLTLLAIARKYASVLMTGKLRAEDIE